jgi:uncharacterized protein YjiS (DUF1127 family)
MTTIQAITEQGPATAKGRVYSPLETYWNRFQAWRQRERLRARLDDLNDRELRDIGIARGEIEYVVQTAFSIDPRLTT